MIASHTLVRLHRPLLAGASASLVCGLSLALALTSGAAFAAVDDVPLGTTQQFAVLAGSGISNTGTSTITGDIGSDPTPSITGDSSIVMTSGTIRGTANDPVVHQAKSDLVVAYDAAVAAIPDAPAPPALSDDIGGDVLKPGVHTRTGAMGLTGTVTLDAEGVGDAVFIIQVSSDFTSATDSSVLLINGAQACHVYWQVAGSATFGTRTAFVGNVLVLTSITAVTNATFDGRLLARDGAVTLQSNTIFRSPCDITTPTTPAPTTPTTSVPAGGGSTATPGTSPTSGAGRGGGSGGTTSPDSDNADGTGGDADTDGATADGDADGSGSDADGSSVDTGLPGTGGPSGLLVPVGIAAVVGGAGLVTMTRRRRGAHRA